MAVPYNNGTDNVFYTDKSLFSLAFYQTKPLLLGGFFSSIGNDSSSNPAAHTPFISIDIGKIFQIWYK